LSDECRFIDIKGPPGIDLKINHEKDGMKSVREFIVKLQSFTEEEALEEARIQAKTLVDILAVLSAKHLGYNLAGYRIYDPNRINKIGSSGGKVGASVIIKYDNESPEPVDLSQGKIVQLIKTFKPVGKIRSLVDRLSHANDGLEAARNKLYEVMIRDFYLAIADKPEATKYEPLRNVLSHHEQIKLDTLKKLKDNFGEDYFDLPDDKFDHRSSKNIKNLEIEANKLMKLAMEDIHRELQK